jgi:hypothetical protein
MQRLLSLTVLILMACRRAPSTDGSDGRVAADTGSGIYSIGWSFSEDTIVSEMDDVTRRINQSVHLLGTTSYGDSTGTATILASCRKGEISVMIHLGAEREDGTDIRLRIDTAPPELMKYPPWNMPGEGVSSAYAFAKGHQAEAFLKRLEAATWLRLEYQPTLGMVPATVRYKVEGLSQVISKVHAACAEARRTADSLARAQRQAAADEVNRAEAARIAEQRRRDSAYRAAHRELLDGEPTDPHPESLPWMLDTRTRAYYRTDCEATRRIPVPARQFFGYQEDVASRGWPSRQPGCS